MPQPKPSQRLTFYEECQRVRVRFCFTWRVAGGFAGAHSLGESFDEIQRNLREGIEMLLENGDPEMEAEFVGTQSITVAAQPMPKPPVLKPREICRVLEALGFALSV